MKIEVTWTGKWPTLCHGEWILKINGEDKSNLIPENRRDTPMYTYGTYEKWCFNGQWKTIWESYTDGLECDEWINDNKYWLNNISTDEEVQEQLYEAFGENDWRFGSCGGCI